MILHTIYDANTVFQNFDYNSQQQSTAGHLEMSIDGIKVQVSQNNSGIRVERIISTNPADYLNPKLQPGSIIQGI